jgi:ADP-heptose:LPS heptosyltransferase
MMRVFTELEFDDVTEMYWDKKVGLEARELAEDLRKKSKYLIGFAPGSVWGTKCWPEEYWIQLMQYSANSF